MKTTTILQIGIYIIFGIAVIFAVLIFSGKLSIGDSTGSKALQGTVTMWGTLPAEGMARAGTLLSNYYEEVSLNYIQKNPATFQTDLVNALASGSGPDLIAITSSDLVANYPRLVTIPYTSLSQDTFRSTFIDQASVYQKADGTMALPFAVDPLVMYYNRDLLTSVFATSAPKTWGEVVELNKKLTVSQDGGTLVTETVALGTFSNILHAKDLIVMLSQQAGNPLVAWDEATGQYVSQFGKLNAGGGSSIVNALSFYTSFTNPADKAHYSWNASLPLDRDQFIAGKLALYFGYASEAQTLRKKNPNLNFGVALMPSSQATGRSTYGTMTGLAVMKMSPNQALALSVAQTLAGKDVAGAFLDQSPEYVSARKDLLPDVGSDEFKTTINRSAIISKSFLDPDATQTSTFFKNYINQINAGLVTPDQILIPGEALFKGILKSVQIQAAPAS